FSDTKTPVRPDVVDEWTGQSFASHAAQLQWSHNTTHFDSFMAYKDAGAGFRANVGFVPQVGLREEFGGAGWTVRPHRVIRRLRVFLNDDVQFDRSGALLFRGLTPGFGMDAKWSGFLHF